MKTYQIIISFCLGLFIGYLVFKEWSSYQKSQLKVDTSISDSLNAVILDINLKRLAQDKQFLKVKDSLALAVKLKDALLKQQKLDLVNAKLKVSGLVAELKTDLDDLGQPYLKDKIDSIEIVNIEKDKIVDSLIENCDYQITLYRDMVAVRDSQIIQINKSFLELSDFEKERAKREQQLTNDLNTTLKELQRKRKQNRVLAGGMLLVSGILTTLIVKSRQ
jgi:hypothetical protein